MKNRILVIGDSCTDVYVYGECNRLCPDAPVPVLIPSKTVKNLGMAGNVYENVKEMNPNVDFITNKETITKTRYVDYRNNHMFVRVDSDKKDVDRIENINDINFSNYGIIIISDYCKGFLKIEDIKYICENHPKVFIDTKKHIGKFCQNAFIIKINHVEYANTKYSLNSITGLDKKLIVTTGLNGCDYDNKNYPVRSVEVKDMTGAGDTFMAALCTTFLKTKDIGLSIIFANKCATEVVQMRGVNVVKLIN